MAAKTIFIDNKQVVITHPFTIQKISFAGLRFTKIEDDKFIVKIESKKILSAYENYREASMTFIRDGWSYEPKWYFKRSMNAAELEVFLLTYIKMSNIDHFYPPIDRSIRNLATVINISTLTYLKMSADAEFINKLKHLVSQKVLSTKQIKAIIALYKD